MYHELFHSPDRPFRATPDAKFYFPHDSIETARQTVVRAVVRAEGPVMVLGGAGLGKSLLSLLICQDLSARFDTIKMHAARLCSRRALLQNILFELGLPYRQLTEGDLRLSILARLEPAPKLAPEGIVIVVDEAHTLPAKLLDELRLITNFTRNNQPRARLVLIGNLRLEHTFAEPQMESFNQRLAGRCYLQPMNREQTHEFVKHQLRVAGANPSELITDSALNTVYAASEGVPRLSNQIADHAMVMAMARNQAPVSSALVEEAWADLQQLPAPWHAGMGQNSESNPSQGSDQSFGYDSGSESSTIEFGTLDDDATTDDADFDTTRSDQTEATDAFSPVAYPQSSELRDDLQSKLEDEPETEPANAVASFDQDVTSATRENNFFAAFEAPFEEDFVELNEVESEASDVGDLRGQPFVNSRMNSATEESYGDNVSRMDFVSVVDDSVTANSEAETLMEDATLLGQSKPEFRKREYVQPEASVEEPQATFPTSNTEEASGSEANPLVRPRVVFDASAAFASNRHVSSYQYVEANHLAPDSFFANLPTDEQMLALEDEQAQYDSMGVWENDPPLSSAAVATEPDASVSPVKLFGDDFDDEEVVGRSAAKPSKSFAKSSLEVAITPAEAELKPIEESNLVEAFNLVEESTPTGAFAPDQVAEPYDASFVNGYANEILSATVSDVLPPTDEIAQAPEFGPSNITANTDADERLARRQAAEAADYIARIEAFAESTLANNTVGGQLPLTVDEVLSEAASLGEAPQATRSEQTSAPETVLPFVNSSGLSSVETWSLDIASVDLSSEVALQNEIEGIISQLNFAAFSVEPYSIEHIAIEPSQTSQADDFVRNGPNDEIYTMHRGNEVAQESASNIFTDWNATFDDDRDLLMVEEDLPISAKDVDPEPPTTKIAPYSQLFAKLRK